MASDITQEILEDPEKYFNDDELKYLSKKIYAILKTKERETDKREEIFTDGSAIKSKTKGISGGYGIFFGVDDKRNVSERLRVPKITNNVAELTAIRECLKILSHKKKYIIYTDSEYSIKSITLWSKNWIKNNWKTTTGKDVKNKELIVEILDLLEKIDVKFVHVRSHQKEPSNKNSIEYKLWAGNNYADLLARGEKI
jgi:ribonuclease HI